MAECRNGSSGSKCCTANCNVNSIGNPHPSVWTCRCNMREVRPGYRMPAHASAQHRAADAETHPEVQEVGNATIGNQWRGSK